EVRLDGRSAEAVVGDVLKQAEERNRAGAVAQYLVGAKLKLRFETLDVPVLPYNQGNAGERRAGFHVAEAAIEVALGNPDDVHIQQVRGILRESRTEVWVLVRASRIVGWRDAFDEQIDQSLRQRLVLTSVEAFVGQNVTELGSFSSEGREEQL